MGYRRIYEDGPDAVATAVLFSVQTAQQLHFPETLESDL